MNYSTLHNPKTPQKQHKRTTTKRLTEEQVRLLESNFDSNKKLEPERKQQLSHQLGIPPRQIAIWYQNKRARWKNQSLEHDYAMLQHQLEATLAETTHLQKEVEQLRSELNKVQAEQARHNKHYNNVDRPLIDYSISVYGDEVRSSSRSLEDDVNKLYCFGDQEVFEGEVMHVGAKSMMGSDLGVFGSRKNLF